MSFLINIYNNIINHFENSEIYPSLIASVLLIVTVLSLYLFFVYHVIIRRSMYNKSFNICITIIPYFVATIILCLQSSIVITLGTIGALAIIRFRTAVKDPIDMIFILWSVYIGIVCGCQLYELAFATSILVTIVLLFLNYMVSSRKSHVLVVNAEDISNQSDIEEVIMQCSSKNKIKSRNYTSKGINIVAEIVTKDPKVLTEKLAGLKGVTKFSLIEYVPDDIV